MAEELRVHVRHLREAQLCSRGARMWFSVHNLDFNEFLQRGIPVSQVDALNDALGDRVAQCARDEANGEAP